MTTEAPLSRTGPALVDTVERAHREAAAALEHQDRSRVDAVSWLSAHLAAVERTVHPAAARTLPDGPARVAEQRRTSHALQLSLFRLDRHLTGDVRAAGLTRDKVVERVRDDLEAHARGEHALLTALAAALPDDDARALAASYAAATAHAPTRPHPFAPARRGVRGLAFRVDALVDRVRDLLDNRRSPTRGPRRPPREPGRWGMYLLGGQQPRHDEDGPSR